MHMRMACSCLLTPCRERLLCSRSSSDASARHCGMGHTTASCSQYRHSTSTGMSYYGIVITEHRDQAMHACQFLSNISIVSSQCDRFLRQAQAHGKARVMSWCCQTSFERWMKKRLPRPKCKAAVQVLNSPVKLNSAVPLECLDTGMLKPMEHSPCHCTPPAAHRSHGKTFMHNAHKQRIE